jgi:hypothetical protein
MLDEYIPDPLEILDMQIDRMIERYVEGQCMKCGKQIGEGNLVLASPHPAAPAICIECAGIDKL